MVKVEIFFINNIVIRTYLGKVSIYWRVDLNLLLNVVHLKKQRVMNFILELFGDKPLTNPILASVLLRIISIPSPSCKIYQLQIKAHIRLFVTSSSSDSAEAGVDSILSSSSISS